MAELIDIRATVRERYAAAARSSNGCCADADGVFGASRYDKAAGDDGPKAGPVAHRSLDAVRLETQLDRYRRLARHVGGIARQSGGVTARFRDDLPADLLAHAPEVERGCCTPAVLSTCCKPESRDACCGDTAAGPPTTCGCRP
jgi:hypothetical protein